MYELANSARRLFTSGLQSFRMLSVAQKPEQFRALPDDGLRGSTLAFNNFEERRVTLDSKGERGKQRVDFVLTSLSGDSVLAAQAIDLGNAHYTYQSVEDFTHRYGTIVCHNKKEMVQWLEMVIKESNISNSGGVPGHMTPAALPSAIPNGIYYVATRHDKQLSSDGRKINRWYLMDQHRKEHLAVIGEERETRDGHYSYVALEPFASASPLTCSNQTGVTHWLEQFVNHHAPEASLHVGDHVREMSPRSPKELSARRLSEGYHLLEPVRVSKRVRVPSLKGQTEGPNYLPFTPGAQLNATPRALLTNQSQTPISLSHNPPPFPKLESASGQTTPVPFTNDPGTTLSPTRSDALPPMSHAAIQRVHKLGGAAEASQLKRIKALRSAAEAQVSSLRATVRAELLSETTAMKKVQEGSRAGAIKWALESTPTNDADQLRHYSGVLRAALLDAGLSIPVPGRLAADMHVGNDDKLRSAEANRPHVKYLEIMEALREVESLYVSCHSLTTNNLVRILQAMTKYPETSVSAMATSALVKWKRLAAQHIVALTDPMMTSDPVATLETGLANGSICIPIPPVLEATLQGMSRPVTMTTDTPSTALNSSLDLHSISFGLRGSPSSGSGLPAPSMHAASPCINSEPARGADASTLRNVELSPSLIGVGAEARIGFRGQLSSQQTTSKGESNPLLGDPGARVDAGLSESRSGIGGPTTPRGEGDLVPGGSKGDVESQLKKLPVPEGKSVSDLMRTLDWCAHFLQCGAPHESVPPLCCKIEEYTSACLSENVTSIPDNTRKEAENVLQEVVRQGNQVLEAVGKPARNQSVLSCLHSLNKLTGMLSTFQVRPLSGKGQ